MALARTNRLIPQACTDFRTSQLPERCRAFSSMLQGYIIGSTSMTFEGPIFGRSSPSARYASQGREFLVELVSPGKIFEYAPGQSLSF